MTVSSPICDLLAAAGQRRVRSLGEPNDVARELEVVLAARSPAADRPQEVADLQRERLVGGELRREDVAAAVGEVVLAEGLGVLVVDAAVVDLDRLGAAVLVDDHLLRADDHRAPQLARRQPAQLDVGDQARSELHRHEGDVGDAGDDRVAAGGADRVRRTAEPVEQDREVVRAEIPDHADVALVEAEVDAAELIRSRAARARPSSISSRTARTGGL